MRKISHIIPLGDTVPVTLQSIEDRFLVKVKTNYNPLVNLIALQAAGTMQVNGIAVPVVLNADEVTVLDYLVDNFDALITAQPEQLQAHIGAVNNNVFGLDTHRPSFGTTFVMTNFGKEIYKIFGYENYFRSKGRKGIWLAKQLNIKTCPYCNSQYTLIISRHTKQFRAKFQFDHFFSKKRYPYLSLSLYNLIPSCAPCNLSKGAMETSLDEHYHPYYKSLSLRSVFKAAYVPEIKKLSIGDIRNLSIGITYKARFTVFDDLVNTHNNIYDIQSCYARYTDIVEDLLSRAILHNSAFKKDIMAIKGLFGGDENLYKRYLTGNYMLEAEILERPLAKFMQDIAKQFEII